MNTILHIKLLGPFEITLNNRTLTNKNGCSQQTQTIAKILFTNHGKVIQADQLIEILWPNDSPDPARRRLHVRISQLRNGLQEKKALIQSIKGGYLCELDESCLLDTDVFQSQIAAGHRCQESGDLRQAINAFENARQEYRGDFLAEDRYEDWTFTYRESFKELFITLLIELSECYAQQGRYRLAIARARQAIAEDPFRESIYTRLMLYHYYAGERAQAITTFDRCSEVLLNEFGVSPLDATKRFMEQIKAGTLWKNTGAPRYPPPVYDGRIFEVPYALNEIPFVGREREYSWLVSQWDDPGLPVILLEGEAGIGKSRLLETFTGFIRSQGVRILQVQLGATIHMSTGAVVSALRSLLTQRVLDQLDPATIASLARAFPDLHERVELSARLPVLSALGERQRLFQAIFDLAKANDATPTIIVVDDAHRLSATAVELLAKLSEPFRVLLSFRSEEMAFDHPLRTTFKGPGLKLQSLSRTAIHELIRQISGQEHSEISSQISDQSEGVPLFVIGLLQHMFEKGHLFINASGQWDVTHQTDLPLPETLHATIETRLNHLNRAQRRIFDYAAVLGGEFNFNLLQNASQQPEDHLLAILDELIDAALMFEPRSLNMPEFAVNHDRYMEVAYQNIPPIRRKTMHLQAAQAIEKLYDEGWEGYYSQLADHYDRAESAKKTIHYASLAGEQAATQFASNEALHYFGKALTLLPKDEVLQRTHLLLAREEIYDLLGMRQEQNEDLVVLEAIRPQLLVSQKAEIFLRRAGYEWLMGNDTEADLALKDAIQLAQACGAVEIEARALLLAGRAALDQSQAIVYLQRARKLSQKTGKRALEGDIVRCLGNAAYWQNQFQGSQVYLKEALNIHREVGDLRGELSALNNLGLISQTTGQSQSAVDYYEDASKIGQKIGDRLAEGVILTNLGSLGIDLGEYSKSKDWLEQAIVIRDQIGNEEGLGLALNHLGDVHRHQGRYNKARQKYEDALAINIQIQHKPQTCDSYNNLSILYRELGCYRLAEENLKKACESFSNKNSPHIINTLINASLLSTLRGDPSQGLNKAKDALFLSADLPQHHAAALKNMSHAMTSLQRDEEASESFEHARSIYTDLGQPRLATEPLAGLALIALANNEHQKAFLHIRGILPIFDNGSLQGIDRVLWAYWICHQALIKVGDPHAKTIIGKAYTCMQERAESIEDQEMRHVYLTTIPENIKITKIWETFYKPD
jgi:DNA-binding SARP family transcriptional activator/Tfp pilus assembly protein PilF